MSDRITNLLLIGFGAHAKRIYYPICQRDGKVFGFRLVCAVDLWKKKQDIQQFLTAQNDHTTQMHYLRPEEKNCDELMPSLRRNLDEIVDGHHVQGVVISTEPLAHMPYARWALRKGLSILMDKPISTKAGASTSEAAATQIVSDYDELLQLYTKAQERQSRVLFNIVTQRRYHPVFQRVRELISDMFQWTNCPVTSVQSFHCDGQWWMPAELVDIDYHPCNQGYGKCSHSGYHFFDLVPWFLEAAESPKKKLNNVDVFTNFLRPQDFLTQLSLSDYEHLFDNFKGKYSEEQLQSLYAEYGEIDAFSSFAFRHDDRILTLGTINLAHNGFSQRGWPSAVGRDLYKGNGRVRQETHTIEQGPFQSIFLHSYQSKDVDPNEEDGIYDIGGEYHCDAHVFRNSSLVPSWKTYEQLSIRDLDAARMRGKSRGHQEEARRQAILEFVAYLQGRDTTSTSDLATHRRGVKLMAGVYISAARRNLGLDPLANIDF
jgi:predicted dehydrogenase